MTAETHPGCGKRGIVTGPEKRESPAGCGGKAPVAEFVEPSPPEAGDLLQIIAYYHCKRRLHTVIRVRGGSSDLKERLGRRPVGD